ncbi:MAG: GNAT family N-acetyltransferase [Acholeplasmataceae bacterium]|nr:GNAT family N-acetyltransferase [Acholeplasmataceae bacterium]
MIYETKRLIVRKATTHDCQVIYAMLHDPVILKYNCLNPPSQDEVIEYILKSKDNDIQFVIEHKETHQVIGEINFERDTLRHGVDSILLSYHLDTKFVGKGYMSEALRGALNYGFNIRHAAIISARVFTLNERSNQLLKHLGFTLEGTLRHAVKAYQNIIYDDNLYSMTKEEHRRIKE